MDAQQNQKTSNEHPVPVEQQVGQAALRAGDKVVHGHQGKRFLQAAFEHPRQPGCERNQQRDAQQLRMPEANPALPEAVAPQPEPDDRQHAHHQPGPPMQCKKPVPCQYARRGAEIERLQPGEQGGEHQADDEQVPQTCGNRLDGF